MAEKKKKSMGKGLGALFSDGLEENGGTVTDILGEIASAGQKKSDQNAVVLLKTVDVEPNKSQPRHQFDEEKLQALSDSIKEHGMIQPILVVPTQSGTYKIVAGERRWRASRLAGLKEIPCIIRSFEEQQVMELALVENLQREDLNPIEEAEGYQKLMDTFSLTQEEISQKVGKSRSAVANSLRLNHLCDAVKQMLTDGSLSQGHARALIPLSPADQITLAEKIVELGLNVRQTEAMVASHNAPKPSVPKRSANPMLAKYYKEAADALSSKYGTKVKISEGSKKGKIEIEYYSKDDLERLLFELRQ